MTEKRNIPEDVSIHKNNHPKTLKSESSTEEEDKETVFQPNLYRVKFPEISPDSHLGFFGNDYKILKFVAPAYDVYAHAACRRGERDEMQDAHSIVIDLWSLEDKDDSKIEAFKRKRLSFFSVYDGHSGAKAATYCENVLHKNLLNNIQSMLEMKMEGLLDADDALCNSSGELSPKHITRCILDAFKQTNSDFIKIVQKERLKDGCTAVVALLYGDLLYTANLGDSAAILAAETDCRSLKCFPLSKEHTASVYSERMRIQKAGGTVKNGRVEGVIEVSRSIGDAAFKHLGVICTPEIKIDNFSTEKLHPHFVILGCDGLWSKMQKQDVVKFVGDFLSAESTHQAVEEILEQQDLQLPDENLLSVEERVKYKVQRTVRYRKMTVL